VSKVTPPGPAGADKLTVKFAAVVPLLPSATVTSLIERLGGPPPPGPFGVMEKSSTERPSSAPEALKSFQRIKNVTPFAMLRFVIVKLIAVRFEVALPSSAPTAAPVFGVEKSSASTSVHAPVVRLVALVLN